VSSIIAGRFETFDQADAVVKVLIKANINQEDFDSVTPPRRITPSAP
jgi:hypothetical protein